MSSPPLLERVFAHEDNRSIIAAFGLPQSLRPGTNGFGYDEGAATFFWDWGEAIPDDAKYDMGPGHVMIHPESALIFAAQRGRFTFLVRPDWSHVDILLCPECGQLECGRLRQSHTLDGPVDFRSLGPGWALLDCIADEDEADHLRWAYEAAGRR